MGAQPRYNSINGTNTSENEGGGITQPSRSHSGQRAGLTPCWQRGAGRAKNSYSTSANRTAIYANYNKASTSSVHERGGYKMAKISDDEQGKKVVNRDGETIGMVSDVRGDHLYVDPDPGVTDKVKSKLGWEEADEDDYAVKEMHIDTVTDDEVRLNR